jgi:lipooligosaccharide transport system permease protein
LVVGSFGLGVYRRLGASARRSGAVTRRNISALRSAYWLVVISGFFEPLLYLLAIGIGIGGMVDPMPLPDGHSVEYAVYLAPAMLASSTMAGALAESTFNFFSKLRYMHLYEGILATPVRPIEVAFGELAWAMVRGCMYSAAFLAIMVAMDLTEIRLAVLAFPASLLAGLSFGALGMAASTYIRSWQDFDLLNSGQLVLFLFSGTFMPVDGYPVIARLLVEASPLYHAVGLVRTITTGSPMVPAAGHAVYLIAMAAGGLFVAGRRMNRQLLK